jgi:catechol 2,3-dioxygenase-like lactoylglutathione lyase family enzyme
MHVGHIELFVRDTLASLEFYTGVLGAKKTREEADGRLIWLDFAGVELLLRPGIPGDDPEIYRQARSAIVLYTEDLAADVQRLKLNGLAFEGDDGPDCPTFRDLDGNWFQLTDPSRR